MPGLGETILGLKHLAEKRDAAVANLAEPLRLTLVAPLGSNPGELRMLAYVPPGLREGAPLVVALHGCTQNAAAYDHGAGWSVLAERHGFAVLFPEQRRANNSNLCFNWFQPEDVTRGRGEVESIRAMVVQMVEAHRLDARRVYVSGLSAGGAMTAAMLATAPELFAGGAVIAGLPYGAASGMAEAFGAMNQVRRHSARDWGDRVRGASTFRGPFPAVQVWHGTADSTVNPGNADELVNQWSNVLGLSALPTGTERVDGAEHAMWRGRDGQAMLERWTVPGLGHGVPVATAGTDADMLCGVPGPHMLAAPISATWHLARGWGLLTQPARSMDTSPASTPAAGGGPASVIERALQAAGLRR